ncbi:hypothetical protein ACFVAF_37490 [Streptomyces sp. NPDC057596]|uniref:hypothetical protein n=1 Tax=Streptomyces sp. NPDC057596 TaxID=3346178 RepID=UPI0036B7013D
MRTSFATTGASRCYYLDAPLQETIVRHATKPDQAYLVQVADPHLRDWYRERDLLPSGTETLIDSSSTLSETVERITHESGLDRVPHVPGAPRVVPSRRATPGHGGRVLDRVDEHAHGPWELRVHRVRAPEGVTVREGGYAVADVVRPHSEQVPGWALTRTESGLTSAVAALYGWDEETGVAREVEANAYGPHSATPYLRAVRHPGGESVHVTLVVLTRDVVHPWALRESITCTREDDGRVTVAFPDGEAVAV